MTSVGDYLSEIVPWIPRQHSAPAPLPFLALLKPSSTAGDPLVGLIEVLADILRLAVQDAECVVLAV